MNEEQKPDVATKAFPSAEISESNIISNSRRIRLPEEKPILPDKSRRKSLPSRIVETISKGVKTITRSVTPSPKSASDSTGKKTQHRSDAEIEDNSESTRYSDVISNIKSKSSNVTSRNEIQILENLNRRLNTDDTDDENGDSDTSFMNRPDFFENLEKSPKNNEESPTSQQSSSNSKSQKAKAPEPPKQITEGTSSNSNTKNQKKMEGTVREYIKTPANRTNIIDTINADTDNPQVKTPHYLQP